MGSENKLQKNVVTLPPRKLCNTMRYFLHLILLLLILASASCGKQSQTTTAKALLTEAEVALASDSVRQGETLLRQCIDAAARESDWHTQYLALQRLAASVSWGNSDEALQLILRAIEVYRQHPDDERNHILLLDYAGTYASQKAYNDDLDFDEALHYASQAHALALEKGERDLVCSTLMSLANISWAQEDFSSALRYAQQADSASVPELREGVLQVLGRCYMSCDSLAQAEFVYRQMKPGDDLHEAYIVSSSLAKIALRNMDVSSAELAVDSAFEQAEELYFHALGQKDSYYQHVLKQEQENERMRLIIICIVFGLVFLAALLCLLFYRLHLVRQRRKYETERHEHRLHLREKENQLLQQQAAAQAEQLRQSSEVVAFLQKHILQRSEVVRKLYEQDSSRRVTLSLQEWRELERTLNAIDGNRFALLRQRYPEMKDDDVQLCILTRLGLTNRAIGNVFCITLSAVQHRKLRIKKDVFGMNDPDVTMEQLLGQFSSKELSHT